jgi:hypothetical protein
MILLHEFFQPGNYFVFRYHTDKPVLFLSILYEEQNRYLHDFVTLGQLKVFRYVNLTEWHLVTVFLNDVVQNMLEEVALRASWAAEFENVFPF